MSDATAPSNSATATPAGSSSSTTKSDAGGMSSSSSASLSEDDLRKQLRSALQSLNSRGHIEPTYKKLLERNTLTRRMATISKNRFYRQIGSRLRERVEVYCREMQGKDPFDRISQRKPLEEAAMRAAFTLREAKEHEQKPLLDSTVAAMAMHPERKRSLDGMAKGLQDSKKRRARTTHSPMFGATGQSQLAQQRAELERQKNQARQWEEARMQRERDDRRSRMEEVEQNRKNNENRVGLFERVFKAYWEMEFANLGGTNPFRIVIDRESAPHIAPDYFNVITTPMNLTYIKKKVKGRNYTNMTQFFSDIDLMIDNALKYNVGDDNPYRIATEKLKKKHTKIVSQVYRQIKK